MEDFMLGLKKQLKKLHMKYALITPRETEMLSNSYYT